MQAFTTEAPSLHLTIALATHDWCWAKLLPGIAAHHLPETQVQLKKDLEASVPMRHSIPPSLICGTCKEAQTAAFTATEEVLRSDERLKGISGEAVVAAFRSKIGLHNALQDKLSPPAAQPCLTQDSFVRRFTDEEKEQNKNQPLRPTAQQGLVARDEIADALPEILANISTSPVQIRAFKDFYLLCGFSKVCFAMVCMDLGLLCACDSNGIQIDFSTDPSPT